MRQEEKIRFLETKMEALPERDLEIKEELAKHEKNLDMLLDDFKTTMAVLNLLGHQAAIPPEKPKESDGEWAKQKYIEKLKRYQETDKYYKETFGMSRNDLARKIMPKYQKLCKKYSGHIYKHVLND